ncbi:Uncharacterised protein [Burkholderia pseudomallei]|nr:hypothetical protein DP47_4434 [Burkholderia pseudomallei Pasteur 52237]CAJ2727640.1 Uncharacterised protein [Burkholderia pseudomallei]CAJ2762050.1 Uncharacterised protein [Burkholderia pseudomallei]CAJ3943851.1 Uncharacterised protein [Burkholderia pseudomallei]CAJ3945794.1 Uncharacterised protein [Burkholderia pseudomallei]
MPVIAAPITPAAPMRASRDRPMPMSVCAIHSATVEATSAMTIDAVNSSGSYSMAGFIRIAASPV